MAEAKVPLAPFLKSGLTAVTSTTVCVPTPALLVVLLHGLGNSSGRSSSSSRQPPGAQQAVEITASELYFTLLYLLLLL